MTLQQEKFEFLQYVNSNLQLATDADRETIKNRAIHWNVGVSYAECFKVPFELVPDLVSRRGVLIVEGWAMVPKCDSLSIVLSRFREQLEYQLEYTARELPMIRDDRVLPLLDLLKRSDLSERHESTSGNSFMGSSLTAADIDRVRKNVYLILMPS